MQFEIGKVYNRQRDIHKQYGGQQQGGISTPRDYPMIFLFTAATGRQYGYSDHWEDEVFHYVGEGQRGDMEFKGGNRAVENHRINGKSLLLFESLGKGKGCRYLGPFSCVSSEQTDGVDTDGKSRRIIVFHLMRNDPSGVQHKRFGRRPSERDTVPLAELRSRAYNAAKNTEGTGGRTAKSLYYARSDAVRDYVLARAQGICESCQSPAPFLRKDGSPYLEPHHTHCISDDGPDHPRWVGALCPNCHREIHYGANGSDKNEALKHYLGEIER